MPTRIEFYGNDLRAVRAVLKKNGGMLPVAGNTLTTLPTILQAPELLTKLGAVFAPLKSFATIFDLREHQPKTKRMVKYVLDGSDTLIDTTNFEQGGSIINGIETTQEHLSQTWPENNTDLNSGFREADPIIKQAEALCTTIMGKIGFWFSVAAFPNTPLTALPVTFGLSDAGKVYGTLRGPIKSLLLDSRAFGGLSHASGTGFNSGDAVHGWKGGIHESSAGWANGIYGAGVAPTAIICATGVLAPWPFGNIQRTLIGLQGMDLIIEHNRWFNPKDRNMWNSLDVVFGCAVGDSTAGTLIKET